ncbi:MAG: U32 family peptidase [Deltaproteobacteria bacterium]|nr:U32 family peptidase [Deltaproteobacteria bacterium]
MQLTLGPILFDWKKEELLRFYDEVADMPVDRVYLGEVVCAKKRGLSVEDLEKIGKKLEKAGKEVVVSSLAVVSNEEELKLVRDIANLPFAVEANDMSMFNIVRSQESEVRSQNKEIIAGPHITTYNVPSIEFLKSIGVNRVVFPVELSRDSVNHCIQNTGIDAEIFAHGKVPLAFSWRCYTSRAYGLNKTNCQYHCKQHPDGMPLKTIEGEPTFTINGTSVLSAQTYTLVEVIEDLQAIGVNAIRISPQYQHTKKIVDVFRKRLDGMIGPDEGLALLKDTSPLGFCNGWYWGKAGKEYLATPKKSTCNVVATASSLNIPVD